MQGLRGLAAALMVLVASQAAADVLMLADGTRITVRGYERQGDRVVYTTPDGRVGSVASDAVDFEATQRLEAAGLTRAATASAMGPPRPALAPPARTSADELATAAPEAASAAALPSFSPSAPLPPEVVSRDEEGNVTVRAVRISEPLVIDGKLDEAVYETIKPINGYVQQEPDHGAPATEDTDTWLLFDDRNFYIGVRCWDSQPELMIANELRRDHNGIRQNENFSVVVDTDYDRRSGYYFATNPLGAVRDQSIGNEGQDRNLDWNTVWDVKSAMDDKGWTIEMVIPFKSMRYKRSGPQVWSINLRRNVRWKNETSTLSLIPNANPGIAIFLFSEAATLVGVEVPGSNRTLELKPFGISSLTTDRDADVPFSNDGDADAGFDVKYGLTSQIIADFTFNTDFAQVEEDAQQVNLTRFNLLFPEKREFFLESQEIFAFGGGATSRFGAGDTPIMFFSRRIGLTEEGQDPIRMGGRVAGRAGGFRVGALNIQTRGVEGNPLIPATNFSVFRLRHDILRRSDIGVIATYRNTSPTEGASSNAVYGVDGNFAFFQNLYLNAYYAKSRTALEGGGTSGDDDASYTAKFDYNGDRYGLVYEHLYVGEDFRPEMGFLRREAFRRNYAQVRFSPRPSSIDAIRRLSWQVDFDRFTDPAGNLESRVIQGDFHIQFDNSDRARIGFNENLEVLYEDFEISDGVFLPVDEYRFREVDLSYNFGAQRRLPGGISYRTGSFWSGNRHQLNVNGRIELSPKFSVEPRVSLNWVRLPEGDFETRLISSRLTYTFSPRMALSSFIQYNSRSDSLSSSVRFRWEYQPGSDLFVVYSEGRDDLSLDPYLANRTFAIKFTRLFRF